MISVFARAKGHCEDRKRTRESRRTWTTEDSMKGTCHMTRHAASEICPAGDRYSAAFSYNERRDVKIQYKVVIDDNGRHASPR